MKHKIPYITTLPKYTSAPFSILFKERERFVYKISKVKILNNVFLSNSGVVIKNGVIPLNSAENLIGFEDHTFYLKHLRKAVEQLVVCKYGKSLNSIVLNDENLYFSIHTPWFGYFSWVTTYLPRLLQFVETQKDAILIYPEEWDQLMFVKQTFLFFSQIKTIKIPSDHHLFIKNYLLIPCRKWTSHFHKSSILGVRDFFEKQNIESKKYAHRFIYISRKLANRRKVVNEIELQQLLDQYDIYTVVMEEYSYLDQIFLMQQANLVIGIHGAGLTNINYMKPNGHLIEYSPILKNFKNFRYPFWRMASMLDLSYYCIFCKKVNLTFDEYDSNIEVPISELSNLLRMIFTKL
jgi:hypothetical protein